MIFDVVSNVIKDPRLLESDNKVLIKSILSPLTFANFSPLILPDTSRTKIISVNFSSVFIIVSKSKVILALPFSNHLALFSIL